MEYYQKLSLGIIFSFFLIFTSGCGSNAQHVPTAAEGLDLHALMGVVKTATTGEDLERKLNTVGGINNLDLDHDGKVDFLDVTEFGTGEFRGYSLVAHFGETTHSTQEIATINIHAGAFEYTVQIDGNVQIYGRHSHVVSRVHRSHANVVPFLAWAYLHSRPMYVPPVVVVGYRPTWYVAPVVVPVTQYRTVTKTVTKTVVVERPKAPVVQAPQTVVNPNAGKTAETIKAPLAAPTATQRQFQARPENKPVATGGFGREKAASESPTKAITPSTTTPQQPAVRDVPKSDAGTVKQFEARPADKGVATGGFGNNTIQKTTPPAAVSPARPASPPAAAPSAPRAPAPSAPSTTTRTK